MLLGTVLLPFQLTLQRAALKGFGASSFVLARLVNTINIVYGCLFTNAAAWLLLPLARGVKLLSANLAIRRRNLARRQLAGYLMDPLGECIW